MRLTMQLMLVNSTSHFPLEEKVTCSSGFGIVQRSSLLMKATFNTHQFTRKQFEAAMNVMMLLIFITQF